MKRHFQALEISPCKEALHNYIGINQNDGCSESRSKFSSLVRQ